MNQNLRGHYAGFVSRLIAYILDGAVIALTLAGIVWFFNIAGSVLTQQDIIPIPFIRASTEFKFSLSSALITLYIIFYYTFFWSVAGRSPGKAFMGLRIVTTDGHPLSAGRALIRIGGYAISTAAFDLGYAWILIDDRRQGWHDKLARTYVIYDWDARHSRSFLARMLQRWGPTS